eukprot:977003_1
MNNNNCTVNNNGPTNNTIHNHNYVHHFERYPISYGDRFRVQYPIHYDRRIDIMQPLFPLHEHVLEHRVPPPQPPRMQPYVNQQPNYPMHAQMVSEVRPQRMMRPPQPQQPQSIATNANGQWSETTTNDATTTATAATTNSNANGQ